MKKSPVSDRMAKVESRLGKTTGASKGGAPPKTTVRPTGNPLKGNIGVKITKKF